MQRNQSILYSQGRQYDNIIMDTVAIMISTVYGANYQVIRNHNRWQLIASEPTNDRYVQIVHIYGCHWVVISNIMSEDRHDIELYDSMWSQATVTDARQMLTPNNSEIVAAILQLDPWAKSISYIETQQQLRGGNGCGPLSLANFWCLARRWYPHWFPHLHERIVRRQIRDIIEGGAVQPLQDERKMDRTHPKKELLLYQRTRDYNNHNFHLTRQNANFMKM